MAKKKNKKTINLSRKWYYVISVGVVLLIVAVASMFYVMQRYEGKAQWIYVDKGYTEKQLQDSLTLKLGADYGGKVYDLWSIMGGDILESVGAYKIEPGAMAWSVARKLDAGRQTPVKVTFNNVRTMEQLAQRVSKNMKFDEADFLRACDSVLSGENFAKEEYPAAFFPDSYEFYWDATPEKVVEKMLGYYKKYWDEEKVSKAKALGLTPAQVSTVASIVEEETNKEDERPKVARLYLNRIKKGMKLQADPTLKFAIGDFSIRRVLNEHTKVESPYNTYKYEGLPPGPIRIVAKSTLDAVLDAPEHDYLYMCAKEDFSGYHNFAVDYDTHQSNAKRYQTELDRRNIKK